MNSAPSVRSTDCKWMLVALPLESFLRKSVTDRSCSSRLLEYMVRAARSRSTSSYNALVAEQCPVSELARQVHSYVRVAVQ